MLVFYVSGHGFGHATRTGAILKEIRKLDALLPMTIRTAAPDWPFAAASAYHKMVLEPRIVEDADALGVNLAQSAAKLEQFETELPDLIASETAFLQQNHVRLIVADIPFVAGLIAAASGIPAWACGNFHWNWIFAGYPVAERIAQAYSHFEAALRYPLSHTEGWQVFPRVIDVPLVTPRSGRLRSAIRSQIGLADDRRSIVLNGGRAKLDQDALSQLETLGEEFAIIDNTTLTDFHDLVRVCDVVVSKPGYSIAAECIAEQHPLVYPPRSGFPEDAMLQQHFQRVATTVEMPVDDWRRGNWKPFLRLALTSHTPADRLEVNGAEVCARLIYGRYQSA
ncbi:MAG: hypothetical protein H7039_21295 [Bryobacteraceae bacterium]|nr:hypothetical protein [Bryobacteraceae bacterium]